MLARSACLVTWGCVASGLPAPLECERLGTGTGSGTGLPTADEAEQVVAALAPTEVWWSLTAGPTWAPVSLSLARNPGLDEVVGYTGPECAREDRARAVAVVLDWSLDGGGVVAQTAGWIDVVAPDAAETVLVLESATPTFVGEQWQAYASDAARNGGLDGDVAWSFVAENSVAEPRLLITAADGDDEVVAWKGVCTD